MMHTNLMTFQPIPRLVVSSESHSYVSFRNKKTSVRRRIFLDEKAKNEYNRGNL